MTPEVLIDHVTAFEDALRLDRFDHAARCAFADFLEDAGLEERAAHERRLAKVYVWLLTREPRVHVAKQRPFVSRDGMRFESKTPRPWHYWEVIEGTYLLTAPWEIPRAVFDAGEGGTVITCGVHVLRREVRRRGRDDARAWLEASAVLAAERGWYPEGL